MYPTFSGGGTGRWDPCNFVAYVPSVQHTLLYSLLLDDATTGLFVLAKVVQLHLVDGTSPRLADKVHSKQWSFSTLDQRNGNQHGCHLQGRWSKSGYEEPKI